MENSELQDWVSAYLEAQERRVADSGDPLWWAVDRFFELMDAKPEDCWQAIVEITRRDLSEDLINVVGAGPLEDLIEEHGDKFIDQIEREAAQSPVFKKMLASVWDGGDSNVWSRVKRARAEI